MRAEMYTDPSLCVYLSLRPSRYLDVVDDTRV